MALQERSGSRSPSPREVGLAADLPTARLLSLQSTIILRSKVQQLIIRSRTEGRKITNQTFFTSRAKNTEGNIRYSVGDWLPPHKHCRETVLDDFRRSITFPASDDGLWLPIVCARMEAK